ncbi:MAG: hypothetical protein LBP60_07705 [Spirochaetaceae bacterium]|nr:hypothetical protein [Spirochaetaceae bacterium]
MKKFVLFLVLALPLSGLFAQNNRNDQREFRDLPQAGAETVTVTGNLVLSEGRIALKSGDELYYVGGLQRLIGFVEGLKEGAQVSLEGYVFKEPGEEKTGFLALTKLTIGDRVYELPRPGRLGAGVSSEAYGPGPGCLDPPGHPRRDRDPQGRPGRDRAPWSGRPGHRQFRQGPSPRR